MTASQAEQGQRLLARLESEMAAEVMAITIVIIIISKINITIINIMDIIITSITT